MKFWKKGLFLAVSLFMYKMVYASNLPSYAQGGDLEGALETKGQAVTDIVTLLAAIVGVIAIGIAGMYFSAGDSDKGKQFLIGGLIGIFIAGAVYSIATLIG